MPTALHVRYIILNETYRYDDSFSVTHIKKKTFRIALLHNIQLMA